MRRVAVVGAAQLPFRSRYPELQFPELAMKAAAAALADAGIHPRDIDSAIYSVYSDLLLRQGTPDVIIHDYLGLNGKPAQRVSEGAATGGYAVKAGWADVASGFADVVLVVGVQKALDVVDNASGQRGDAALTAENFTLDMTWQAPFSWQPWAMILNSHMHHHGGPSLEQMADVAVKNRANAVTNPNAQLRSEVTRQEVLDSRLVSWPTTMFGSCLYGECAAALVLMSEDRVSAAHDPVWITGVGTSHHNSTDNEDGGEGRIWSVQGSANQAYRMAGISDPRSEFDLIELNDLVAGLELLSYAELGLCPVGQGGRLLDSGATARHGDIPVNPSGGRIGAGHIAGVSGVHSVAEVTQQLRRRADGRQVDLHTGKGLVSVTGGAGLGLAAAIVLSKEAAPDVA